MGVEEKYVAIKNARFFRTPICFILRNCNCIFFLFALAIFMVSEKYFDLKKINRKSVFVVILMAAIRGAKKGSIAKKC